MPYFDIVFMQGDEADEVLDKLERRQGDSVVYAGPTSATISEAVDYLSQWDFGDESEHTPRDEPSWGANDKTETVGDYILSWNLGLTYVGLTRKSA